MMILSELLPEARLSPGQGTTDITGLASDSRDVRPGYAFFAVPGAKTDGSAFVPQAIGRGAVAVVVERPCPDVPLCVATVITPDVRLLLARSAARFYPRQPGTAVAVTGTSGKTSVVAFARQIWEAAGLKAASLGTLGTVAPGVAAYGSLTTPDPIALHRALHELAAAGVTHVALEASSHGLDQHRLDGVRLSAGAFTNLSRDHLDYHPSVEAYLAAKMRLFQDLLAPGQPAVVDADSPVAERVISAAKRRRLTTFTVGAQGRDLRLAGVTPDGFSSRLRLDYHGRTLDIRLPLAGGFQISNALVAAGLCLTTGTPDEAVFAALAHLVGAPGRLELVGRRAGAPIFIDYAHKPDALENVLTTLRPYAPRRLVVVFGCGGDRDAGKRPIMGSIAARRADVVLVTDDNPRSECPRAIRGAILEAAPGAQEIPDRGEAIASAIALLEPGDVLVIAGKGHETGQIVGDKTLPFSDAAAVASALARFEP